MAGRIFAAVGVEEGKKMTATLNDLIHNDHGLRVFCDRCHRCAELDVPS